MLDVREVVRRLRLGERERRIARDLAVSRNTVAKYRKWAEEAGFLEAAEVPDLPTILAQLKVLDLAGQVLCGPSSKAEPYREFIKEKRKEGVEIRALLQLLEEKGFTGSYSCLRRFVARIEKHTPTGFVRVETAPGEEAQVDFGYAGMIYDRASGRERKSWVFVMTLSYSRHQFAEIVFDQKIETWLELHIRAFEWFGAVPKRIVVDNLKAAIVKAVVHDQEAQRSYRDLAEYYGFLISPCRPYTPEHKGKVESGVRYVSRNGLAGREFKDLQHANEHLRRWVLEVAGVRTHGTTQEAPLDRFERERAKLGQLPATRFELAIWKKVKAHRDCHIVFDYAYYSFPHRYIGNHLWVRATPTQVVLYLEFERITSHDRATRRGEWKTKLVHYPPEKLGGLLANPEDIRLQAQAIGTAAADFVDQLLGERPMDRLQGARSIVTLATKYSAERVNNACARALEFGDLKCRTVKSILQKKLDLEKSEPAAVVPLPKASRFARPSSEMVPACLGRS